MEDERKTKKQLIEELHELRQSVLELKGFEEEIQQSRVNQEKFTKAFRQNSIPVTITTAKEGRFVDVSDAFLRLVELKRDEVIGHTSRETGFITDEQRAFVFNELSKNGRVENLEVEVRPKGRGLRYGLFNLVMMSFNNENYLLTTIQDITDRKKAEEMLRENQEYFKEITENSSDIIVITGKNGDIKYCSSSIERFTGYKPEELIGKSALNFIHPDDTKRAINDFGKATLTIDSAIANAFRIVHKDGSERYFDGLGKNLLANPIVSGFIMNIRDITERKEAEEEKAKLEAQNRQLQKSESLGCMAGAIAHHFNNQLGVVIGNLEIAIGELPLGAPHIDNLTAAMEASNKAAEMSGLMLTYLGQASDKREPLDLSNACLQSLSMLQTVMPGNVVIKTDLPTPGPTIKANENQIQQLLTNLITNAREAVGDSRGAISLSIKTVSPAKITKVNLSPIGWQPKDSAYACLEVSDTGCGIVDMDIEKLFDPFYTSKFTGRGMGLPVVIGIIKAHEGAITVESEQNRGSTFRLFFPVSTEEAHRQPDIAGNDGEISISNAAPNTIDEGGTVLLIEDEETLRNMAAAMLTHLGFTVLEAKDGAEAMEVFRQHKDKIRFVLSDLTMPRMSGWDTLTALRKLAPDIPVILTSGYNKTQVMAGDHPELPQAFLGKPYKLKELIDAINLAITNKKK